MKKISQLQKGFSVIEVILAAAMFVVFATGAIVAVISGLNANRLGNEVTIGNQFNAEGMEAVRSIKNQSWSTFAAKGDAGNTGVTNGTGVWAFKASPDLLPSDNRFSRIIVVSCIQRDASGNISGSIACSNVARDDNTRKVVVTTSWNFNSARPESVVLTEYLTKWKSKKGGMVVYGDGGTTTDAIKYRLLDGSAGTWNTAAATADVDAGSANKALRVARLYASSTRNEKILISRHYNGTAQFIYAQVFNGTTWGNVLQLSTWTAATFLDVQNFDGTYLNNGNFMVIYSDNTVIPKARIWDGTTWQAQTSLTTLGASQIPNYIVAAARPSSNEVMAAFFTQGASATAANTITQYYNGTTWSAITSHGTTSITNTKRMVDFIWSGNTPTIGALVFSNSTTDKTIRVRTGTASGGVFTWGTTGLSAAQTNNLGSLNIAARPNTANEFVGCDKDAAATPLIICYRVTHAATPTFSAATTVAAATDTGIERSFHTAYKSIASSGNIGLTVYSNNSGTPQLKKFNASTVWDASATPIATTPYSPGIFKAIRLIPQDQGDDIMIMMADANIDLYSVVYNGASGSDTVYTTPSGKAFSQHGLSGSAITDFWFDFAWDRF